MAIPSCHSKRNAYYGNTGSPKLQRAMNMNSAAKAREDVDSSTSNTTSTSKPRSPRRLILAALAAVVVIGGATWYITHRGLESTDDAQLDADIVMVPARVGGTVSHVRFVENQSVKAGDLLAEIDDAAPRARLAQAEAALAAAEAQDDAAQADAEVVETNALSGRSVAAAGLQSASVAAANTTDQIQEGEAQVRSAEANLAQATNDRERARALLKGSAIPKVQADQAETAYTVARSNLEAARAHLATLRLSVDQAKTRIADASARVRQSSNVATVVRQARARAAAAHAQVETARAARDLAALDVSYTRITAPHDGVVSKKTINEGQTVSPGQSIVALVTPRLWVTANFKETQVGHMKVGQPAHFTVDAFPGVTFTGRVESISGATGSRFTLLPPDNATGNYTKVVQRMPVRVSVADVPAGIALRPGLSVELTVDTRR
jgi:membrane fusion protein (multidrug efflux system)